ncbi:MAG: serine hydrolase [Magnetovibrio sp.]|nr:serine hydrolase [Magnetovibrio sp.]
MTGMKDEFPPPEEGQVKLNNWRASPFNKWAFHHVREIIPSAEFSNDPNNVWAIKEHHKDLGSVQISLPNHEAITLTKFLKESETDGFLVLHKGNLVYETYSNGMTIYTPHILMSVSKSILGLLAGILVNAGILNEKALASVYVPEIETTAYQGATIRNLLDMQVGVLFNEDYEANNGLIINYRQATNWNPLEPGQSPTDLRSFYQLLTDNKGHHEGPFHYVSPNTDLLAWIIERASGKRYVDLMSEYIWRPLGAERSGYVTVDRLGAPRAAGGMCITLRDLARVGQLIVQEGNRNGVQIIPNSWLEDIEFNGSTQAWNKGSFVEYFPGYRMRYRSQWYISENTAPLIFGLGIHGQHLFIDKINEIVIAKMSSLAKPLEFDREIKIMGMVAALQKHLSD